MLNHAYGLVHLVLCVAAVGALPNAEHIFNAVHSSLRQWGSSLNHNGVSFFRARVPRGTKLYHGTYLSGRVVAGMEWLAFEPEHAMNFAFKPCDFDGEPVAGRDMSPRWWWRWWQQSQHAVPDQGVGPQPDQETLRTPRPLPPLCLEPGWIHTYAPTRDLDLLYVDGTSAAKTTRGTLDSQDHVLLWDKRAAGTEPWDPRGDIVRGARLCGLAADDFGGKVDGFVRMEHGFELILCDFAVLEVVSILRSSRDAIRPGPLGNSELDQFSFLRAITSRYAGIGGRRVHVDHEHFVTAFSHPDIDFWPDGDEQPRLDKISNATASRLFEEVKQMVLADHKPIPERIDWQSIMDLYVDRYAKPVLNLFSPTFATAENVHKEVRRLFQPYLNQTTTDRDATIKRCQQAFIPTHLIDNPKPSLGQQATEEVAHTICTYLHGVMMERDDYDVQKAYLMMLMDTLKWTAWKDCEPGCALDEICWTAIWPFGTVEDHDRPSCLNATGIRHHMFGYWIGGWGN